MDIKEIISRNDRLAVSEDEAKFVVQEYIKEMKGVDVKIGIDPRQFDATLEYVRLMQAFNYAKVYYTNKYASIYG